MPNTDQRVMQRLRPFVEQALEEQTDSDRRYLTRAIERGQIAVLYERTQEGDYIIKESLAVGGLRGRDSNSQPTD